jgi:transposase InsO family protein
MTCGLVCSVYRPYPPTAVDGVIDTLAELFAMRSVPRAIRSDIGPELVAAAIQRWLKQVGVETLYIAPGSPWENCYAGSFHGRLRDGFLDLETFKSLLAARQLTAGWRGDHNHHRPHGSLGYVTPVEFAARCAASAPKLRSATPQATSQLQQHSGVPQPLPS